MYDTTLPIYERLETQSVTHLHNIIKECRGGSIGFDPFRNPETKEKNTCIAYIKQDFTNAEIQAAHDKLLAMYAANKNSRPRRGRRRKAQAETVTAEPVVKSGPIVTVAPEPKPEPAPVAKPAPIKSAVDPGAQMAELLRQMMAQSMDAETVRDIVRDEISKANLPQRPQAIEVIVGNADPAIEPINVGIVHKAFPTLLNVCNARKADGTRLNAWLAGPAGTGKTHAAKLVAQSLDLTFYSDGALSNEFKLSGYLDANGNYVRTAFREAFEHGGVYLLDELDASHPTVTLELMSATSASFHRFPDQAEPIQRHPDCVIIASANTWGTGATAEFNGRQKQDNAFMSRFVPIEWPLDEGMEAEIFKANPGWVSRVQYVRERAKVAKLRGFDVSMRATEQGAALLAAGIDQKTVETMVLRRHLTVEQWAQIS